MTNLLPRAWFRFSLRTMFVVVTVLCFYLAWESSVVRERRAARRDVEGNAAFQLTTAEDWLVNLSPPTTPPRIAHISLVRRLLGDQAIQQVRYCRHFGEFSEEKLDRLTRAFPEAEFQELHPEPCHPGCFPVGTLVETPRGPRRIEAMETGDLVTVILPGGQSQTAFVQSVFVTQNRLWNVQTDAGTLVTTQAQPLCLAVDRTRAAGELEPGDEILRMTGGTLHPARVQAVFPAGCTERVINLVLGDCQVFVAGGFLARSKPPAEPGEPASAGIHAPGAVGGTAAGR